MRDHAVIIGASVAGLLAARVASDHFKRVTILERDRLPTGAEHRPGVPQGRHVHGLLVRGAHILNRFFPGFTDDLEAAGAPKVEWLRDTLQVMPTGMTPRASSGIFNWAVSRPLVESVIRQRIKARTNITFIEGVNVTRLVHEAGRVHGVEYTDRRGGDLTRVDADLVIDASGRASKLPEWLTALGYDAPTESLVSSKLGYATRTYTLAPDYTPDWKALLILTTPARPRGGVFTMVEDGRWMLTLAGVGDAVPPTDEAGVEAFIRAIPVPQLHEALAYAQPVTPIYGYRRTENTQRHYERLKRMPAGLIVTGDAVCAFNPVYGQGMSVSAMAAEVLEAWLREDGQDVRAFQRRLARSNAAPWAMATNEDYRYPTEGDPAPLGSRFIVGMIDWLYDAITDDVEIARAFIAVLHLIEPPASIFHPRLWMRRWAWGRRRARQVRQTPVLT